MVWHVCTQSVMAFARAVALVVCLLAAVAALQQGVQAAPAGAIYI